MLQKVGIRWKLIAVIALPVLLMVSALGYIVASNVATYRSDANVEQLIRTLDSAREVKADLQTERRDGVNYAHTVRAATTGLATQTATTAEAYATLAELAAASEVEGAADIMARVTDALGGAPGAGMLDAQHSLTVQPPAEAGQWLGFPSEDEIQAQQDSYAAVLADLDRIADSIPEEMGLELQLVYLAQSIEAEAELYLQLLQAPQAYQAGLEETFVSVDQGLDSIAAAVTEVRRTEENEAALAGVEAGSALRESLPELRAGIMSAQVTPQQATDYYSDIIGAFDEATAAIAIAAPNTDLVASMQAFASIDAFVEDLLYEEIVFERMIRDGVFAGADASNARSIVERSNIGLETAQQSTQGLPGGSITVPEYGASVDLSVTSLASFESIRNRITNGLDSSLISARDDDWPTRVDEEIAQYTPIRDEVFDRAFGIAQESTANARTTSILVTAAGVIAIVLTLVFAFVIARRIAVPLRRLTTTATAVQDELPRLVERVAMPGEEVDVSEVQIPVTSSDEVGRLAQAFNGVNAATLEIAREQAALRASISEMFVNVARRDQVLLNRQLASIDEMERTEDDPTRLTKLFALDHLATRMRRNSESLLVLAGIDTGRRLRRAMPLSDVVRTASSEIELYERVDLELVVDPAMHGHQALTAAHLFAELLENATVFSDPGSRVIVRTGRTADGFTVEVIDTGIGMTAEELAEANSRVQSSAASEILGAQRLGMFVVGRIARRLGAQVAIASAEGKGTVATVLLPASLFEGVDEAAPAVTPAPAPAPAEAEGGYAPAALVTGASLSGRGQDEAPIEPVADEPIAMPTGLDALIAADAAAAPAGPAVSGEELTEGTSAAGLPSRRRRRDENAPAGAEESAVIGLPVRATAAQLSALEAESAAFTPSVPADEVSPQTPEERASMFRGFLPRRDSAPGTTDEPAAEPEGLAIPGLEPDEDGGEQGATADEAATPTAAQLGGAFAAFDAIRRASADGPRPVEPVAVEPEPEPEPEPQPEPVAVEPEAEPEPAVPALPSFAMPKLMVPIAPESAPEEPADQAADQAVAPAPAHDAPAEPGSPLPSRRSLMARDTAEPAAPETGSPLARSPYGAAFAPVTPAPQPAAEQPEQPEAAAAEASEEPAFTIPMLEPDGEAAAEDDAPVDAGADVPATDAPAPAAPWLDAAAFAGAMAAASSTADAPAEDRFETPTVEPEPTFEPAAFDGPPPGVETVSLDSPELEPSVPGTDEPAGVAPFGSVAGEVPSAETAPEPVAQPSLDDLIAQASGEEAGRAGFFGRLFGRGRQDTAAPPPQRPRQVPFAPTTAEVPTEPAASTAPPAPEPASFAPAAFEPAPTSFAPADDAPEMPVFEPQPAPAAPEPVPAEPAAAEVPAGFTPEQLAQPSGWEAAGQDALAASTAESGVYTPIIDTEGSSGRSVADDEADLTRDVFAELSSLSETRPKVEKTKAGLQKRRKPAEAKPEVKPLDEEVTLAHKERDAEAVRNRFSSFYSGTQRARSDAAELDLQAAPQHANE